MEAVAPLAQIDLNLLYTFRAVLDAGGVGAAARTLGRTQPAVSARLRQLERDLGRQLFERHGRGLALTRFGRLLAREVGPVLAAVHQVVDRVRSAELEPVGTLRVGTFPTLSTYLLAPALLSFVAACPRADVEVRHGRTAEQLAALVEGALDVVVSAGPVPTGPLVDAAPLRRMRAVAATRAKEPGRGPMTVRQLGRSPIVGYGRTGDLYGERGDEFFDAVWRFLERHGLDAHVRVRVSHIQAVKRLVQLGAGVGILPDYTIVEPDLVARPVQGLAVSIPIWMAVRRSAAELPLVAALRKAISLDTSSVSGGREEPRPARRGRVG